MLNPKDTRVAVLMGGWSAEREVSLSSGNACAKALQEIGYQVIPIDVGRDIASVLTDAKPDVAFNALHGKYGEDGTIQGLFDMIGVPYAGCGVLSSAVAMEKDIAKRQEMIAQISRLAAMKQYYIFFNSWPRVASWLPHVQNFNTNLGYDYGGRLEAAWFAQS